MRLYKQQEDEMAEQFVTVTEAHRRAGVSLTTLRDRARRGELVLYNNPRDKRSRLVALEDLDRLLTPQPVHPQQDGQELAVS